MTVVLPEFSVLLPVYDGDEVKFFVRAFESVTREQELPPTEVVVVRDGPVRPELQLAIDQMVQASQVPVQLVELPVNTGLANALNMGLEKAKYEVIARADADDISLPRRFKEQLPLIASGVELLGSAIIEFESDEQETGIIRAHPVGHEDIGKAARFYSPFNHPTVMFTKSAVQRVGGYQHLDLMEDYLLFARMVHAGTSTANLAEGLVLYRVGAGAYKRRGGMRLLKSELKLQSTLHREGFTSKTQYMRNLLIRGVYRMVPQSVRRIGYRNVLLRTGKRPQA